MLLVILPPTLLYPAFRMEPLPLGKATLASRSTALAEPTSTLHGRKLSLEQVEPSLARPGFLLPILPCPAPKMVPLPRGETILASRCTALQDRHPLLPGPKPWQERVERTLARTDILLAIPLLPALKMELQLFGEATLASWAARFKCTNMPLISRLLVVPLPLASAKLAILPLLVTPPEPVVPPAFGPPQ